MKQKDIALIVLIIILSTIFSMVISGIFISTPKNRSQQVEVVTPISSSFDLPSDKYFNENSVNPTKLIQIGDSPNQNPFGQ